MPHCSIIFVDRTPSELSLASPDLDVSVLDEEHSVGFSNGPSTQHYHTITLEYKQTLAIIDKVRY